MVDSDPESEREDDADLKKLEAMDANESAILDSGSDGEIRTVLI